MVSDGNRAGQKRLSLSLVSQQNPAFLERSVSCITQSFSSVLGKDFDIVPLFPSYPLPPLPCSTESEPHAPTSRLQLTCPRNVLCNFIYMHVPVLYTSITLASSLTPAAHSWSQCAWRLSLLPWRTFYGMVPLALFQCRSNSFPGQCPTWVYRKLNTQSPVSMHQDALHNEIRENWTRECFVLFWFQSHQISQCRRQSFDSFCYFC